MTLEEGAAQVKSTISWLFPGSHRPVHWARAARTPVKSHSIGLLSKHGLGGCPTEGLAEQLQVEGNPGEEGITDG